MMKKLNRTYVCGIFMLALSLWIGYESTRIPTMLVSNEPGPRLFPCISAIGIALFSILSMLFDGRQEKSEPYLDRNGFLRLLLIIAECLLFALLMHLIGFWLTSMLGLLLFIWTLKGEKRLNLPFCIVFCILLGSSCYFGFTRGFHIPLPAGTVWESLGIPMP